MKEKTNVLIVGAPRSGTTLLAGIISAGTESAPMLPECTYMTQTIQHYFNILNYSDAPRFDAFAISEDVLISMFKGTIQSMLATASSHFNKIDYSSLILKDPELTLFVDLIPEFFGDNSKVVCVVRDPRSVIASMLAVEHKKRKSMVLDWKKTPSLDLISKIISQIIHEKNLPSTFFNYYYSILKSKLFLEKKLHIVSYEKIIKRDEKEFERLEKYLGFQVSREGFGKPFFEFDRNDPTFSNGYGNKIQKSKMNHSLSKKKIKQIELLYSGINLEYGWW